MCLILNCPEGEEYRNFLWLSTKQCPKNGTRVLPMGNWEKSVWVWVFYLKSWASTNLILCKEGLRASLDSNGRIGPMGAWTASRRKPSRILPAHWKKCDNIPINHISELLLPVDILLSFCVLGIKFHRTHLWIMTRFGGYIWKAGWPKRHHKACYLLMPSLIKDSILPRSVQLRLLQSHSALVELSQPRMCHPQFIP